MDLVKSWLGQALRATGAAVVVPVAILAALSLTALGGGGLGGLGSLSRIVSGPEVAGSDVTVDTGDEEISSAVGQLAAADAGGEGSAGGAVPPTQGGGTEGNSPGTPPPSSPPPSAPPPSSPPPGSPPPGDTGVVGGVGEGVKDVTAGTPVAPTVEDAVDTLVNTCRQLNCP